MSSSMLPSPASHVRNNAIHTQITGAAGSEPTNPVALVPYSANDIEYSKGSMVKSGLSSRLRMFGDFGSGTYVLTYK